MMTRVAQHLLWDKDLSRTKAIAWSVIILLSPIALAAAVWLQTKIVQQVPARIEIDRLAAVAQAERFLAERQVDVSGWSVNVTPSSDRKIYERLADSGEAGRRAIADQGLWCRIIVYFRPSEEGPPIEVTFDEKGRLMGYRLPDSAKGGTIDEKTAAAEFRREWMAVHPFFDMAEVFDTGAASITRGDGSGNFKQGFIWSIRHKELDWLTGSVTLKLDDSYRIEQSLQLTAAKTSGTKATIKQVMLAQCFVLLLFLSIRYFKRRAQKEASRPRLFLVMLAFAGYLMTDLLLTKPDTWKVTGDAPIPYWLILTMGGGFILCAGALAGLAYSAAEGDLREGAPGVLCSVDALLRGRVFTRNVGRSVVAGLAVLAWTLLIRNTLYVAAHSPRAGLDFFIDSWPYLFSTFPAGAFFLQTLTFAIFWPLVCLGGPAVLLQRSRSLWRKPAVAAVLAALMGFVALTSFTAEPLASPYWWLIGCVQTLGLSASFWLVDLLASIVWTAGFTVLVYIVPLGMVAPHSTADIWLLSGFAVLLAAASLASAVWGKTVSVQEVSPDYAQDIAERLLLESEVEAARVAQQRLLPLGPPAMEGLSVAASCHAAETVSGDFYDFFPLSRHRLGILLTDGGGNGLATALNIAFAKGFLMHMAGVAQSPTEAVRELESKLGTQLRGERAEGFCYAVVDLQESSIRFARIGISPQIFVAGTDRKIFETMHQRDGVALWEGHCQLLPGERAILYTNGLEKLIGETSRDGAGRWLKKRHAATPGNDAAQLHDSIVRKAFSKLFGRGRRAIADDVTVVVVAMDQAAASAKEQVA
ncbi:MAG: SpoIIE family protein phosphatase [Candidatus Solibacter usitatus]|nr:SpoIIE family protein phosphatase [Candidatus Solibacter usitatus]